MPDPDPELADRLEEARALSMLCGATGTAISHADAKAAAVRLREQDAEIARLNRLRDFDKGVIQGYAKRCDRLDRLDRLTDAFAVQGWTPTDLRFAARSNVEDSGAGDELADLLRRLAHALEDTDG